MANELPTVELPQQPLGIFETRCDDKGRIRLPTNWFEYFTVGLKDKKAFTTSLDGSVIRIYPESIWRENLSLFEKLADQSDDVENILALANHYGTECDLEGGRVMLSQTLRNELELLGDLVVGSGTKGVIHLRRKSDHDNRITNMKAAAPTSNRNMNRLGMK